MARKPKVHIKMTNADAANNPLMRAAIAVANSNWADNISVPMPKIYERRPELIGQKVTVYRCHGNKHELDNKGCLCDLIGQEVEISGIDKIHFVGTPYYHIKGSTKIIQEREFVPVEQEYEDGELGQVKKLLGHDYVEQAK